MKFLRCLAFLCAPVLILAQPPLRLKIPPVQPEVNLPEVTLGPGRVHIIVQFQNPPSPQTLFALLQRGVVPLQYVPDNAVLVAMNGNVDLSDLGVLYMGPLTPQQKISPLIATASPSIIKGNYLIEFHPDVDPSDARRLILNLPLVLVEHPDLASRHLLVRIPDLTREAEALATLAAQDEVEYIFPASPDLIQGVRVVPFGDTLSQNVATLGDGWDGPGRNAATLFFFFSHLTAQLPELATQGEILRAMAAWTAVAQITWLPGTSPTSSRTVNILFAAGDHGDGFPFDGPGGVLAHTFVPPPAAPEPIAGDVHFDDAESWHIGSNFDVFSVGLHELGHALGLAHSDDPRSAMYPYYKLLTGLGGDDAAAIQSIYAAKGVASPLSLTLNVSPASTTAESISLTGTVNSGATVRWSSSTGSGTAVVTGTSWLATNIPLVVGANVITVTAADTSGTTSLTASITRQATSPPPPAPPPPPPSGTDTTAPTLTITYPSSTSFATILSSVKFTGTASDRSGIASVTWSTNTGSSGTAVGITSWSAVIPLLVGSNTVIIRSTDTAGNMSWKSVVVARR